MREEKDIKDQYYSKVFIENPWEFLKRFMPVIGADILVACASIALAALLTMLTYLSTYSVACATKTSFSGAIGFGAAFALAKYQVLNGRIRCVWINVGIYLACLVISLPTISYRPNLYLYAITLFAPLLGLLILNSNRCRELRRKSVEIRHKREAIIATLKQQGRWKWW